MAIPEVKVFYKVRYRIAGYQQEFESAPYAEDEVEAQKTDIATYAGVHSVYTVPAHATSSADDEEAVG